MVDGNGTEETSEAPATNGAENIRPGERIVYAFLDSPQTASGSRLLIVGGEGKWGKCYNSEQLLQELLKLTEEVRARVIYERVKATSAAESGGLAIRGR